jgi:hypothetical protein
MTHKVNIKEYWEKILVLLLGGVILTLSFLVLGNMIRNWKTYEWGVFVLQIVIFIVLFPLGIAVILSPFGNRKFVSNFIKLILYPIAILVELGEKLTSLILAYYVLLILISFPLALWLIIQSFEIVVPVSEGAVFYTIFTLALIIFTLFSNRIARRLANWSLNKDQYQKLDELLKPSAIRVSIYGLMTLAYFLSRIEMFSGITLFKSGLWIVFNQVVVEVLLTYVAFDSLKSAWNDDRKTSPKQKYNPGGEL